jgi:hypothetical protein
MKLGRLGLGAVIVVRGRIIAGVSVMIAFADAERLLGFAAENVTV